MPHVIITLSACAIAVAGLTFGRKDALVELEFAPREPAQGRTHRCEVECAVAGRQDPRRHDRAGVHHRVERPACLRVDGHGVERIARRFDTDAVEDGIGAAFLERHAEHERLRDRLDRECLAGVADFEDLTVDRAHRDREVVRVSLCEFGNIRRNVTVGVGRKAAMNSREDLGQRRTRNPRRLVRRSHASRLTRERFSRHAADVNRP